MSDLNSTSYYPNNNKCDSGNNSMFLILILLLCGGDNGIFGGCSGKDSCGCNGNGIEGMLPILLLLTSCGGFGC